MSRVVLDVLGVNDYGIYNIVGGVVVLFNFINNILTIAIRRFIANELVNDSNYNVSKIFKASIVSVYRLSFLLFVVIELVGIWLVNFKLNIPHDRLIAANWCFQFSLITFVLNFIAIPYNAAIVAYEKMNIYAYYGIIDVFLRLGIVILLQLVTNIDMLILYSFMMCVVANFIRFLNVRYCQKNLLPNYKDTKVDQTVIKSIFQYSSWALIGAIIGMAATQGVNILMNIFYGVAINAAIGIAQQVSNAILQFGSNFQTAFNPQLTKSFASSGLSDDTYNFCIRTSKLSLILIVSLCVPIIAVMSDILSLWLIKVPAYTAEICIISLVYVGFEVLSMPLYVLIYAKGDVKNYSITLSLIQIIYTLGIFISCKLGNNPVDVLSLNIINAALLYLARLFMLKIIMQFNIIQYFKKVLFPIIIPMALFIITAHLFDMNVANDGFYLFAVKLVFYVFILICIIYFLYLTKEEKLFIQKTISLKK
jgi:O-antigen/teichoic acid export membrane protein